MTPPCVPARSRGSASRPTCWWGIEAVCPLLWTLPIEPAVVLPLGLVGPAVLGVEISPDRSDFQVTSSKSPWSIVMVLVMMMGLRLAWDCYQGLVKVISLEKEWCCFISKLIRSIDWRLLRWSWDFEAWTVASHWAAWPCSSSSTRDYPENLQLTARNGQFKVRSLNK